MARKFDVAVMHDFFVDRLVHAGRLSAITDAISEKEEAGGGGVHGFPQDEVAGGNAVNLARGLARLGLRTLLITHSDPSHEGLLRNSFKGLQAEVRVKPLAAGLTVAFEGEANIMLNDVRGAGEFGPSILDESDWDALEGSKVVCSVNWASNRKGTELLVALRSRLGGEKTIFFDPADFRDRAPEFQELLRLLAAKHLVDWVSMNTQEGGAAARALGIGSRDRGKMCRALAGRLGVVFDLHGLDASLTSEGTRLSEATIERARPRRLTGAGDAWDAGAIFGRLRGMDEAPRLRFANRVARLYLQSPEHLPPTIEEVMGVSR
jgi:sugar/nucleoside kinase (ribokinase family)